MSKKAEARLARRLAKELREKERTVRRSKEPDTPTARSEYAKDQKKEVRIGANPGSIMQMKMSWSLKAADRQGEWSWGVQRDWGSQCWQGELLPKLQEFAKLSWAEIEKQTYGNESKRHRMHHLMETADICGEAQRRMTDIGRTEDTIFRFRLGNLPRLWGIRVVAEFRILWYDPTHRVYPVD